MLHLKNTVTADLAAEAAVITDPVERRRVFTDFVEVFNARPDVTSPWPRAVLKDWMERSPLARVTFIDDD